jgi:hypothetical protein
VVRLDLGELTFSFFFASRSPSFASCASNPWCFFLFFALLFFLDMAPVPLVGTRRPLALE